MRTDRVTAWDRNDRRRCARTAREARVQRWCVRTHDANGCRLVVRHARRSRRANDGRMRNRDLQRTEPHRQALGEGDELANHGREMSAWLHARFLVLDGSFFEHDVGSVIETRRATSGQMCRARWRGEHRSVQVRSRRVGRGGQALLGGAVLPCVARELDNGDGTESIVPCRRRSHKVHAGEAGEGSVHSSCTPWRLPSGMNAAVARCRSESWDEQRCEIHRELHLIVDCCCRAVAAFLT